MGKKKNKHRTLSLRSMSRRDLEKLAQESIVKGNLRIARDAYKELVRLDENHYMPDLLNCYNLLAEKMASNGQIVEAENLLSYIATLGGTSAVTFNLDTVKADSGSGDSVLDLFARLTTTGDTISPDIGFRAADAAMAGYDLPAGIPEPFRELYNAATSALEFICTKQFDDATAILRRIPFNSPFSRWKLFVRGMCSYYNGNDDDALKAFGKIDPATVPGQLARSFLVLLDCPRHLSNRDSDREKVLERACTLTGHAEYGGVLPRAQYLWMTRRHRDSLQHVISTLPDFPSRGTDIAGLLTNFYFTAMHHLDDRDAWRYIEGFNVYLRRSRDRCTPLHLHIHHAMCNSILHESDVSEEEIIDEWESFLNLHKKIYGYDKELEAEVYLCLGIHTALNTSDMPAFFARFDRKADRFPLAETCLKKSLELSPGSDAYRALINLYRREERNRELRRTIEEAVDVFPEDKQLLQEAGIMAVNRKAFRKGIGFLEKAHRLDPLDSKLRELLIVSCINAGRRALQNRNGIRTMRQYLDMAESYSFDNTGGFNIERCYTVIRRAAFECIAGNENDTEREFDRACEIASDRKSVLYFGYVYAVVHSVPSPLRDRLADEAEKLFDTPTIDNARTMVNILDYGRLFEHAYKLRGEELRCIKYCAVVLKEQPFVQADVMLFFEFAEKSGDRTTAKKILRTASATTPRNPLYRFLRYRLDAHKTPYIISRKKREKETKKLQSILDDARKAGDDRTASLVAAEMKRLAPPVHSPFDIPFPIDLDFPDFDDDFFDGEDIDDVPFIPQKRQKRKRPKQKRKQPKKKIKQPVVPLPPIEEEQPVAEQMNLFGEDAW